MRGEQECLTNLINMVHGMYGENAFMPQLWSDRTKREAKFAEPVYIPHATRFLKFTNTTTVLDAFTNTMYFVRSTQSYSSSGSQAGLDQPSALTVQASAPSRRQ